MSSSNSSLDPAADAVTICAYPSVLTMVTTWLVLYILLLPLFLYVIYLCSLLKNPSHSDFFTLHIIAMEIITMLGTVVYLIGGKRSEIVVQLIGSNFYSIGLIGQMFIHTLTCAERYLAVAHPIMYLRLKERGGVIIRNTSIVAVWLLSVAIISVTHIASDADTSKDYIIMNIFISACSTVSVVAFCCISVLNILIRPGPGKDGRDLRRIDQSKHRAFSTIMAIAAALVPPSTDLGENWSAGGGGGCGEVLALLGEAAWTPLQ
uniref:G-protein coupled receptors family 1 profile domain-containing protein n=1 Tax=Knipowitschia caucasica TaxID=637954 RepID=A0AAV2KS69_KNICA